jgi:hypothetical protein
MGFMVRFLTMENGLWEMDKWGMGFGYLRWLRGYSIRNSKNRKNFGGNGG